MLQQHYFIFSINLERQLHLYGLPPNDLGKEFTTAEKNATQK